MTATATDPGATTERLLDAAEHLFAERGLDAVSVRAVNAAAGANVAAVHYHFGSKDALIDAVLRRRMDALAERRAARLAALPPTGSPPVRAVVEVLVVPLAELCADPAGSGRAYVRVLAALDAGGPDARRAVASAFAPQFGALDAAFARALPALSESLRHFRLALVGAMVVHTLATREPGEGMVAALVDAATGTLTAPATTVPSTGGTR